MSGDLFVEARNRERMAREEPEPEPETPETAAERDRRRIRDQARDIHSILVWVHFMGIILIASLVVGSCVGCLNWANSY